LVDTAADRTVVSTQLASRLNLTLGPTATLHSATGASTVRLATVPGMEVANGAARTVQAPMLDAKNMGADGILGIDSLRSRRVLFDFQNRLISIVPSAVLQQREEKGTIIVRGKLRKGHLILTKAHADDVRLTVLVDTGAEISLGNLALKRALERRGKLRDRRPIHLLSVTGERLQGEFFFLQELEIGGVVLRDLAIVFADAHTFGKLGLGTKPTMMLGMNGMRAFQKVSIDFASKKLRVLVPRTSELSRPLLAVR
jgi:predicted aspartyl protease